jgi:hypothetical protein
MRRGLGLPILLAATLALTGCVAASSDTIRRVPTLGQELVDLKAARDSGAMSEMEYQRAKDRLLSKQ